MLLYSGVQGQKYFRCIIFGVLCHVVFPPSLANVSDNVAVSIIGAGHLPWWCQHSIIPQKQSKKKRVIVVWTKKKEGEYMKRMWMEEETGDARGRHGTIKLLESGHVTSRNNRRECVTRCMNVNEARSLRQDRVVWRSVFSAYPCGETVWWLVS